ncbi:MAG TPA: translation elongation factor 4 [Thermodesulfovibrio thiophilus]|uniref:translation elongation factor 4 n=1 Tax=Thermodesulfovibrio thiophilus TaxID=340095 RepID=UPI00185A3166|nr:translation elongation factor 4 [Thermodesulfovibrio thiophilus]HHW21095.1 elongation factor 4 [Thermodesulfovibrio thiophilus]HOA83229.1 translation elongation factor 4 [Thermodesulfovibrio thiophilus]HQA03943.1 translation elongation factor 4 [Thermodesulfovibrio thiophilus]HQD36569.1 translation elongation factor 4 [Thermodesulfovibrio thiophilus]
MQKIRNFSIIAHIDHGKSTLADRLLEITGAVNLGGKMGQILDSMDLERERGITIKAHAVRLHYKSQDGQTYILNLIDTPGHVDFSYEVSRSLACCEGSLLVVDATQGVEAQTVANAYLAIEHNHEIIPVINKIDLPQADPEKVKKQIEDILGISSKEAIPASAKEGTGAREILEAVVKKIPPPKGDPEAPLRAMIFDSWFDNYLGVIVLVRVFDGIIKQGMRIKFFATQKEYEVQRLGILTPLPKDIEKLTAGEVGFIIAGIKNIADTKIGDTITDAGNPAKQPLPGFREVKPMVFCGLYPTETHQYEELKLSLEKLRLNDSSFFFEPETSAALGFGFRCGFLGLLHMEIIKERLEREFNLSLISTAPTVRYKVVDKNEEYLIDSPSKMPKIFERIEEPFMKVSIIVPEEFVGEILKLCQERRGIQKEFSYITKDRILLVYEMPLNEILWDFYDKLKSLSRGYASMDYEFSGYRPSDLVKLDILINGEQVDALSVIVHKDKAYYKGRAIAQKLREVIPRQLFEVAIQAAIGGKIIARESIAPLKKNVLAKCYGGDVTRKRKLLEKQKEGKKRMKQIGRVEIPQEAFLSVLKVE